MHSEGSLFFNNNSLKNVIKTKNEMTQKEYYEIIKIYLIEKGYSNIEEKEVIRQRELSYFANLNNEKVVFHCSFTNNLLNTTEALMIINQIKLLETNSMVVVSNNMITAIVKNQMNTNNIDIVTIDDLNTL